MTYNVGNLIDAFLRIADLTPFPSLADLFYLAFFPVLFTGFTIAVRASSLRASWGRLLLDSLILVLGFGTFFWFFVISPAAAGSDEEFARFVLAQVYIALDCLMLMAIGVLLMNSSHCPLRRMTLALLTGGFGMMFLGDIVWATSVVENTYLSGANFSDVLYLACYAGLAGAAQVQIRDKSRPERQRAAAGGTLTQAVAYAGLGLSFFVLVYFAGGDGSDPVTVMTVSIFVLAVLVMARQSVILRDDAQERQRKAVDLVEARFASLIRNASDVIMIVDADGRIEYASPAVQRTFGLWQDDLVGRRLARVWREADRERIAAFLAEVTATHGTSIGPVELSGRHQDKRFIARVRRQQPAGRPRGQGARAQPARRHRAQGARGPAAPARVPRPADPAREPQPVPQPRRARARALAAHAGPAGGPHDRPRQFQERERFARATTSATGCCRPPRSGW